MRGLDHVSAVGRLAAGGFRSLEEWGHVVPRDHLADEHRRGQQRSIDRCGSPSSKPRESCAHQITAGGIRRPGTHPPLAAAREQVHECRKRLRGIGITPPGWRRVRVPLKCRMVSRGRRSVAVNGLPGLGGGRWTHVQSAGFSEPVRSSTDGMSHEPEQPLRTGFRHPRHPQLHLRHEQHHNQLHMSAQRTRRAPTARRGPGWHWTRPLSSRRESRETGPKGRLRGRPSTPQHKRQSGMSWAPQDGIDIGVSDGQCGCGSAIACRPGRTLRGREPQAAVLDHRLPFRAALTQIRCLGIGMAGKRTKWCAHGGVFPAALHRGMAPVARVCWVPDVCEISYCPGGGVTRRMWITSSLRPVTRCTSPARAA